MGIAEEIEQDRRDDAYSLLCSALGKRPDESLEDAARRVRTRGEGRAYKQAARARIFKAACVLVDGYDDAPTPRDGAWASVLAAADIVDDRAS